MYLLPRVPDSMGEISDTDLLWVFKFHDGPKRRSCFACSTWSSKLLERIRTRAVGLSKRAVQVEAQEIWAAVLGDAGPVAQLVRAHP